MYVLLSSHNCFGQKRNNASNLTSAKNTTYTNHKPSHEYEFYLDHIWTTSTWLTQDFPWVHIWLNHIGMPSTQPTHALHHIHTHMQTQTHTHTNSHAYTYTYKLTYAQPPTYVSTSLNLNIHTHGLTITHIYVQIQEHSVPNIFLSFRHIHSIIRVSSSLYSNPSWWMYTHQTNLNRNPNKKCTINRTN